jgi:uncharacterized membrane protein YphA (DoxX/SURF4 family)
LIGSFHATAIKGPKIVLEEAWVTTVGVTVSTIVPLAVAALGLAALVVAVLGVAALTVVAFGVAAFGGPESSEDGWKFLYLYTFWSDGFLFNMQITPPTEASSGGKILYVVRRGSTSK